MDAEAERLLDVCEAEGIDNVREVVTNNYYYRGTDPRREYTRVRCGVETENETLLHKHQWKKCMLCREKGYSIGHNIMCSS